MYILYQGRMRRELHSDYER